MALLAAAVADLHDLHTNAPADADGFITCSSNCFENVNRVVVILVIHVHKGIGHCDNESLKTKIHASWSCCRS